MNRVAACLILPAILLAACAPRIADQADARPDWVTGSDARWPADVHLLGRGQAADGERARDRARADLARIFSVAIEDITRDVRTWHTSSDGDISTASGEVEIMRDLRTRTDRVVRGIEISDQWHDPDGGQQHALATMSRARAAQALRTEIRALDERTGDHVHRARDETDLLRRIDAASRAVAAQRQREALQRQLQVVDVTGRGVNRSWDAERLAADRDQLLSQVRVRTVVEGVNSPQVARVARSALAAAGVTAVDDGEYLMRVVIDEEEIGPRAGWYWRVGRLELELLDPTGTTRGGWRWPLRVPASERAMLDQRLYDQVESLLEDGFLRAMAGMRGGE